MSTLQKISPQGKKQLLRAAPGDSAAANYHCAPGAPFSGRTYYVSPSGDDANAGTSIAMPWRTVNRVNQQKFGPCDKVLFEGPKLYEGGIILEPPRCGGLPGKPIMISSWGSGRAIVDIASASVVMRFVELNHDPAAVPNPDPYRPPNSAYIQGTVMVGNIVLDQTLVYAA